MKTIMRVHIAPIGRHAERVIEPIRRLKADKVYLLTYSEDDNASEYLKEIKKILKNLNVETVIEFTDIWDTTKCLEKIHQIIKQEKDNQVFINVSTGTKITSIASIMACMFWQAEPYYAKSKYPSIKFPTKLKFNEIEEIVSIPTYTIESPTDESIIVLEIIQENGQIQKKVLIEKLKDLKIIKSSQGEYLSKPAEHGQLRTILDTLLKSEFIKMETQGRNSFVKITEKGKTATTIFREK
jgi:CRISPR locus-related DNA-binding protein